MALTPFILSSCAITPRNHLISIEKGQHIRIGKERKDYHYIQSIKKEKINPETVIYSFKIKGGYIVLHKRDNECPRGKYVRNYDSKLKWIPDANANLREISIGIKVPF